MPCRNVLDAYNPAGDIVMGQDLEDIDKIQDEIDSELENLGMDPAQSSSKDSSLSDQSIEEIDKNSESRHNTQSQIVQELEDALSDSGDEVNDISSQVGDALEEIESLMEQSSDESASEDDDIGAFDENELDEIMSEIDDLDSRVESEIDNVVSFKPPSKGKDMCFQASGEMEAKMGFNLSGRNISFEVEKNGVFKFQMDQLTLTVDQDNNVIVDLGGGMKLTAPLEDSKNSGKKKAV